MVDLVKIWSFEHDAWWRASSQGYTTSEADAGLYGRDEAERIVAGANYGGSLYEEIVEVEKPSLKEQIATLIREINAQDNRMTASPYYYIVQSKRWVDSAIEGEKEVIALDGQLYTLEEWLACPEYLAPEPTQDEQQDADAAATKAEQHAGELRALGEREWHRNHPFWVREEWEDKEIFLTEKAALLYMRANAHHLNEPRTYVKHFWRNSQMETVFRALEEFSGEELVWR